MDEEKKNIAVYLDVSGSVHSYLPKILGVITTLKQNIETIFCFSNIVSELRGVDNYFNNGIYKDNWTYNRMTIGNPLLSPISIQHSSQELIQQFGVSNILNNRVSAYNFKINYNLNNLYMNI